MEDETERDADENEGEGVVGRVAWVDLAAGRYRVDEAPEYARWLGGRGFADWVVLNRVRPGTSPLSPDNVLVMATGCFTGTAVPGSSRTAVVTKNVLNGGISYSNVGGFFGPEMKKAGFDALVIEGRAPSPIYLFLHDGIVEFKDASGCWGLSTWATEDAIRDELGDARVRVASIGPAGENLANIACIIADKAHAAAWGGSGAVMGSKNLKAVAARGDPAGGHSAPRRPRDFEREVERYRWTLLSSSASDALRRGGTHGMAGAGGWNGLVPTSVRNLKEEYWDQEKARKINEAAFRAYEKRRTTCFNCPLWCLHWYEMESDGEILACEGIHANSARGFGSNWDVDDPYVVLKAHALCNELGLNVDGVSSSVAWAAECYENGIIGPKDTGGAELRWGNGRQFLRLITDTAYRKGLGDLLARGVAEASRLLGRQSGKFAMQTKGVGINEQGLHSHRAWALGIAVSTRGGGHLGGCPQTEHRQLPRWVGKWLFDNEEAGNPVSYAGKGRLVCWYEIYKAIVDCVGVCYFDAGWYEVALADVSSFAALYEFLTGVELDKNEMWNIGRKVLNMEKAFNTVHAGFGRDHDSLPARVMEEPLTLGPFKGERLERDRFEAMLDEYYSCHGWDPGTGLQKATTLDAIGAREILRFLADHGHLRETRYTHTVA